MNKLPSYACFELTSRCNLNCSFCFGVKETKELGLNDAKKIIKKLKSWDFRHIVLSGGEPLLRDDIKEIITFSKKLGLRTALSTNGILLSEEKIKEFKDYLDWICLPLDGPTEEINSLMRTRGHFSKIIEILKILDKTDIEVKINTVVARPNIDYIKDLGTLLNDFRCIKKWKLFQFTPIGLGQENRKRFEVSKTQFSSLEKKLSKCKYKFEIFPLNIEKRANTCFLIFANGELVIPAENNYVFLGKILEINLLKLQKLLNKSNYNFNRHFNIAKTSYDL